MNKHVAVMSQVMNLENNELDVLANFWGHNIEFQQHGFGQDQHETDDHDWSNDSGGTEM